MSVWLHRLCYAAINSIQQWGVVPGPLRGWLVRFLGHKLSAQTYISSGVFMSGRGLSTEGSVSINARSFIDANGSVHIEDGVRIACGVMLVTTTHELGGPDERAGAIVYKRVRIGKGCWIGARATILPGVTVARGCIIAAGAVVSRDTELCGVYAGVPAVRIKDAEARVNRPSSAHFALWAIPNFKQRRV